MAPSSAGGHGGHMTVMLMTQLRAAAAPCVPPSHGAAPCPKATSLGRGVTGVQVADDTYRLEVPVQPDRRDTVAAALFAAAATGVWERVDGVVAWFNAPPELTALAAVAPEVTAAETSLTIEADRDWQAAWKATITPLRAGRIVVLPSWLAADHPTDQPTEDEELQIVLDPGRAFGTGHHATTALCLEFLDQLHADGRLAGRSLADVGTGSGILAIAAAARGADVQAVDIDPDAVTVASENAAINGVTVSTRVGSTEAVDGPTDIVVANLISDVVRDLAVPLVALSGELLLVSGITVERWDDVRAALAAAGAQVHHVEQRDGWIAALLVPSDTSTAATTSEPTTALHQPRSARRLAGGTVALLLAAITLTACTTPGTDQLTDNSEQVVTEPELDPEEQALATEVEEVLALVADIREALTNAADAATAANATAARDALERADALLVTRPDDDTRALLPAEDAERTEERSGQDAFTSLLTQARETGGGLGRSVVEVLRDPIVGDLGAWELDAPGVVTTARDTGTAAVEVDAVLDEVLALDGEATKAIAWIAFGLAADDAAQIGEAAALADGPLEVVVLVLRDLLANPSDGIGGTDAPAADGEPVPDDPDDPDDPADPGDPADLEELGPVLDDAGTDG